MKRRLPNVLGAALLLAAGAASVLAQTPVDNGWTYQGRLTVGGSPATGNYDLRFTLYSNSAGTTPVGSPQTTPGVAVSAGLFTVHLDFGAQFTGSKRWLKVEVSPAGAGTYTALPLQEITSAPQSLFAEHPWTTDANGNISFTGGKVGIGRAPFYGFDVNVTPNQAIRLGLDGNGGGQLILANNNGDNRIYIEGWNTAGTGVTDEMLLSGYQGGFLPQLTLHSSNTAADGWLTVDGFLGVGTTNPAYRLHVIGTTINQYPAVFECNSTSPGCNAVRAIVNANASSNYSAAVTALNTVAPGAGQLNFGLYATASGSGEAVRGDSQSGVGVVGTTTSTAGYGGYFINTAAGGIALWADGLAQVKTLRILGGSDLAEPFDVSSAPSQPTIEPGMVVVIDESHPGELRLTDQPYDSKVAGVVSGANGLAPGMIMKAEGQEHADGSHPVAMTGRAWVWVDASFGAVKPGDLLTTSATAGHAMRASDQGRSFGAVVGKAMTGLDSGKGLVLVLVNLQ
jgi:hypothetical protein